MKLISCHIENYGKISNEDFEFDESLTAYCAENGHGKSTLASFLKAMFYGLDSDRANSTFNERRHFYPFQGGSFGGNVTFWRGEDLYKIERFFDEKSESKDTVTVYINKKQVPMSGSIGEELFGIDRQSFERTVFISGDEIEISSTSSINSKMNNLLEGGNDDSNIDTAISALDKICKEYKKTKGGNDLISRERAHIDELIQKISNLNIIKAALNGKYFEYDERQKEIIKIQQQIKNAQTVNVVLKDWEQYDSLLNEIEEEKRKLNERLSKYPKGVPTEQETAEVNNRLIQDGNLKAQLGQSKFDETNERKLTALLDLFKGGVPDEATLASIDDKLGKMAGIEAEIGVLGRTDSSPKEKQLKQRFEHHYPSEAEFQAIDKKVERYHSAKRELDLIPAVISETVRGDASAKRPKSKAIIPLFVLAIAVLIGGIAMLFVQQIVGIVLSVLGVVGLFAVGFIFLVKRTGGGASESVVQRENPERKSKEREVAELEDAVKAFVLPFGYSSGNGVVFDFLALKEDVAQYVLLLEKERTNDTELAKKRAEMSRLTDGLRTFFSAYGMEGTDFNRNIISLREKIGELNNLKDRKNDSDTSDDETKERIKDNISYVVRFCEKYGFDFSGIDTLLSEITDDVRTINVINEKIQGGIRKANGLKAERNLVARPDEASIDVEALSEELNDLVRENSNLLSDIKDDESQLENLDDLNNEKEEAERLLGEYATKHKLLNATISCMQEAERNLKDKYVKPIKDKFVEYSALLERALGEKVSMSKDFEIRFEKNGKERSEKHLSTGQRSICALCFRLALIWNMYSEEKPFLIMDDPFVSLDEKHFLKVKSVLTELSKGMQIIYFTCHESRAM